MVRIFSDRTGSGEYVVQTTAIDTETFMILNNHQGQNRTMKHINEKETDEPMPTAEGVALGTAVLKRALEEGWDFVLCINVGNAGMVTQTNMRNEKKMARMLEKFATMARRNAL